MRIKKFTSCALLTCALITGVFLGADSSEKVFAESDNSTPVILNSSFESATNGEPDYWILEKNKDVSISTTSESAKYGSKCLKIQNDSYEQTYVRQKISLKRNTCYKLTGYIKSVNVSGDDDCDNGPAISVADGNNPHIIDSYNNWGVGTYDWKKTTVYFETGSVPEATIECSLGSSSALDGKVKGTAYFDNIEITECTYPNDDSVQRVKLEGDHIVLVYTKDFVNSIGMDNYKKYLKRLDTAYEKYAELTGSTPAHGEKLYILDSLRPSIKACGALASYNPILCNPNQHDTIQQIKNEDLTGFGILHEISHKFEEGHESTSYGCPTYKWNFDIESWANTKMLYVLDSTDDIGVKIGNYNSYSTDDLKKYYKTISDGGYDNTFEKGKLGWDAMTYLAIKIKDKVGWDTYKKAFRHYTEDKCMYMSKPLDSNCEQFLYFLSLLQYYYNPSGREVYDIIGDRDMDIILDYWHMNKSDLLSFPLICESKGGDTFTPNFISSDTPMEQICIRSIIPSLFQYRIYSDGKWSDWSDAGTTLGKKGSTISGIAFKSNDDIYDIYYTTVNENWVSNGEECVNILNSKGLTDLYIKTEKKEASFANFNQLNIVDSEGILLSKVTVTDNVTPRLSLPAIEGLRFRQLSESLKGTTSDRTILAEYESCEKILVYYKGVQSPSIYYHDDADTGTFYMPASMNYSSGFHGCDYSICINADKGHTYSAYFRSQTTYETDFGGYKLEAGGIYTIIDNKLTKVNETNPLRIKRLYLKNTDYSTAEKLFDVQTTGGKGPLKYKYTSIDTNGEEHVLRDYCEYSALSRILTNDTAYISVYVTDGYTTENKKLYVEYRENSHIQIRRFKISKGNELKKGESAEINFAAYYGYGNYNYTLKINGNTVLQNSTKTSYTFTPDYTGKYIVELTAMDCRGVTAKRKLTLYAS